MLPESGVPVAWFVTPNPGPLTLDGSRCYAVGSDIVILVDPGPAIPGQMERLERLVADRPVSAICLTHAHSDHAGLAELAGQRFEAPVAASADTLARKGLAGRPLEDGDHIEVAGASWRLSAIRTPGHSADHLAYLLEPGRAVFTGDLVLGTGSSAILHPDGEVRACLESFRRVLSLGPGRLYPGHGRPIDDGEARLREYADHRLERHSQVERALAAGASSVAEVRRSVYGDLDRELVPAADASVRAHLVYLASEGGKLPPVEGLADPGPPLEEE